MSKKYDQDAGDDFELNRFLKAQENVYPLVLNELKKGKKQSHWMWFIFPQIEGLGTSSMARLYSIESMAEAQAYFNHPVLGARLTECTTILLGLQNKTADEILGFPDNVKLQSCMTLFSIAVPSEPAFEMVLEKYYENLKDKHTVAILNAL